MKKNRMIGAGLVSALILSCAAFGQPSASQLFSIASEQREGGSALPFDDVKVLRWSKVSMDLEAIKTGESANEKLVIPLFDKSYSAKIEKITTDVNGVKRLRARLEDDEMGWFTLTTHGERSLGIIEIPGQGKRYELRHHPKTGNHVLLEVESLVPAVCGVDHLTGQRNDKQTDSGDTEAKQADGPRDPAVIDLLIVYTAEAEEWADTYRGGIANAIAQGMEITDMTLENSDVQLEIELVHSEMIDSPVVEEIGEYLPRLRNTDGISDEIHAWRDAVGADLVAAVLGPNSDNEFTGIAYVPYLDEAIDTRAFSATEVWGLTGSTFAHELGHNLGAHHHKFQALYPGPGRYDYSGGWRWTGNDSNGYRSIMSYAENNDSWIPQFSNPDLTHLGAVTGDPTHGDNARGIREFKHTIAGYRTPPADNDLFSNATVITGECGNSAAPNTNATKEPSETDHGGDSGGASLWWEWEAPYTGEVFFSTEYSTVATNIAMYQGAAVSSLTENPALDLSSPEGDYVRAMFDVQQGTTYHIAVDGEKGARGLVALSWCYPGAVVAYGGNGSGQLDVPSPNRGFVAVEAGRFHSVALRPDGTAVSWGRFDDDENAPPSTSDPLITVSSAYSTNLGLTESGKIVAWGSNFEGELDVPEPNSGFIAVEAADNYSVGLRADGSIEAWGDNSLGQLNIPQPNTGFVGISAWWNHTLALRADGSIVAWGDNADGQLDVPEPNSGFVAIAAGFYYSLAIKSDGSLVGWGDDGWSVSTPPLGITNAVNISASSNHNIGLSADGRTISWGTYYDYRVVKPWPNSEVIAASAGSTHNLALFGPRATVRIDDTFEEVVPNQQTAVQLTGQLYAYDEKEGTIQWRYGNGDWENTPSEQSPWSISITQLAVGENNIEVRRITPGGLKSVSDSVTIVRSPPPTPTPSPTPSPTPTPIPEPMIRVIHDNRIMVNGSGTVMMPEAIKGDPASETSVIIANPGDDLLELNNLSIPAPFSASFESDTVAAGDTTTLSVQMATDSAGDFSETLTFNTNVEDDETFTLTVTGSVIDLASPTPSPVSIDDVIQVLLGNIPGADTYDRNGDGTIDGADVVE